MGQYTSSSIGIDGLGVISYYDSSGSNLDLKVAHCVDVACSAATSTTVDSAGTVGWYTSLTIGADAIETDVCVTRDGEFVLWHDRRPDDKVALFRQAGVIQGDTLEEMFESRSFPSGLNFSTR